MDMQSAKQLAAFALFVLSLGLIAFALFAVSRDGADGFLPAIISGAVGYCLFEILLEKNIDFD
ncbi:hypothetical protein [Spartinivicinus poritis]|uniref:Uncharacterized protein n=1 Tax=Spartinivicinus poritis TaxID=2994640 RepID=A0ABT5UHT2_9GAMM|nr:hypothetical protein [Spartinivicinus sp. A2-2]MDE1465923.1 hypothetical protein [Spartinivicinus sp. A2-2]